MSDQNPYEKLGVAEDSTFDEIQDARTRLLQHYSDDLKSSEAIEAAYDAILMERLRMRQEGKIKVPEGIRFAERLSQAPAKPNPLPIQQSPTWVNRLLDRPSLTDVLLPGALFLSAIGLTVFYGAINPQALQLTLVVGVGLSLYFLNRKEGKFGRAVILTVLSLLVGLIAGGLLGSWLLPQVKAISLTTEQFSTLLTLFLMWVMSSFLR